MSESNIAIIILFIFIFTPLIIAEVARSRSLPSLDDFFLCNRNLSTPLYFFTIYATWYSSFAVLGSTAHFYSNGPVYMTTFAWNSLFAVLIYLVGRRIWFYGKKQRYITPTDFFSDIYNYKPLSILITIILLVFSIPYIQIQFFGGAYLIDIASNGKIPWEIAGLIFYSIMVVYLWAGGLRAVAMTDVFFGILTFVAMISSGLILGIKSGWINNIFQILEDEQLTSIVLSSNNKTIIDKNVLIWLSMCIITPIGALMSPPMWIRNYSVKKEATFALAPFLIAIAALGYVGCLIAGNAGKVLNPNLTFSDSILPTILTNHCGEIVIAIIFCGLAAASLSTANSQIHALSAIYTVDIYKKYINKNVNDSRLLHVAKWSLLGFSILTYVFMISKPSIIISTGLLSLSGTAQIFVPVLGALFWKNQYLLRLL